MKAVEASAKTREEAIQTALKQLGVEMYEVDKIEIVDEGSKGILGFGARPVRVRLIVENMPDEPQRPAAQERGRREGGRGESGRGDRPERGERNRGERGERSERGNRERTENREGRESQGGTRPPRAEKPAGERGNREAREGNRGDKGNREGNRDGNREGGRGRGRDGQQQPRAERDGQQQPRGDRENRNRGERGERGEKSAEGGNRRGDRDGQRTRPERKNNRPERSERPERRERPVAAVEEGDVTAEELAQAQDVAAVDTTAPITDEQGLEAATTLQEIIEKMGIAGTASFVRSEDGGARINVSSEDSAILIGRKGKNLSAMQYLINRMISRTDTNENTERIVVDVEGYVDRRRESLEELARSMATRAKETQRNMRLKPLSPQERRIIHLTLQGDEDIRTFSLGDSLFRSVVISPKGAVRPERAPRPSRGSRGGRRRGGRGRSGDGGRHESQDIDVGALSD